MNVVNCKQYSPEWWAARRGIPTASEFDAIISPTTGEYPKAAAFSYICRLIADRTNPYYGQIDGYASAAMRNGIMNEPRAARYYEFERGVKLQEVGLCLSNCGRFGASPDRLVGDDGVLEAKAPDRHTHIGYLISGDLPPQYRPQCHGQLVVTGRKWCDFLSWSPGLPALLVRVEPTEYTAKLRANLDRFLAEYDAALKTLAIPDVPLERTMD